MSGAGLWWAGRGCHGRGWSGVGQGEAGLGQDRSAHPSGLQGSLAAADWRYAAWGWGSAGTWDPLHASGTVKNIKKKIKLEAPLSKGTSPWSPYRKSKSVIYLFPLKNKEVLHQPVCFTSWAPASSVFALALWKSLCQWNLCECHGHIRPIKLPTCESVRLFCWAPWIQTGSLFSDAVCEIWHSHGRERVWIPQSLLGASCSQSIVDLIVSC